MRWLGGLRFSGWIAGERELATAAVLVDGVLTIRVRALAWSHAGASEDGGRAAGGLDFHLPERFADGAVHQLQAIDQQNQSLEGSPLAFLAFAGGLNETLLAGGELEINRTRAELFNQLAPMSLPMSDYQGWRKRLPVAPDPLASLRGAVIAVGPGAMDETLASLDDQTPAPWIAASLPPTADPTGFRNADLQDFLRGDGAACDFALFMLSGTVLAPAALARVASAFQQFAEARAVYGDLDVAERRRINLAARLFRIRLPSACSSRDIAPICSRCAAPRRCARRRTKSPISTACSIPFSMARRIRASDIVHLPFPLATLPAFDADAAAEDLANALARFCSRKGVDASVTPRRGGAFPPRASYGRSSRAASRSSSRRATSGGCWSAASIRSVRRSERRNAEIIVVDNDSSDPDTLDYLGAPRKRRVNGAARRGPFNFARLNNRAAASRRRRVLCLLNNDIEALDDLWLDEMLSRIAEARCRGGRRAAAVAERRRAAWRRRARSEIRGRARLPRPHRRRRRLWRPSARRA